MFANIADRVLEVPEGDYPDVASEIVYFIRRRMEQFSDELHEFLDLREEAAPATVNCVRALDSVLSYEVRRWLKYCER
ncbi:hypothetical protein [Nocardia brasiliensis]|uniref:hypothetical protein n=1 Tax=Nocardia brasiliensis TaxID=37326 RepID=UPI001893A760|nr:hypothetical protein [Nocardia brasiliensis]MBF6546959.1 hypothetical protein [Nocardia brasiliensis]